jgi:hypothetical protein
VFVLGFETAHPSFKRPEISVKRQNQGVLRSSLSLRQSKALARTQQIITHPKDEYHCALRNITRATARISLTKRQKSHSPPGEYHPRVSANLARRRRISLTQRQKSHSAQRKITHPKDEYHSFFGANFAFHIPNCPSIRLIFSPAL